jgi:hemolysin III
MSYEFREPVSGLTHLGGAVLSAFGTCVLLYVGRDSLTKELSLLVYGATLILMFSASAAYHLIISRPQIVQWLRKADHGAIYLLIAGTYTPICLHFFTGVWRWGVLATVWTMAFAGIAVKMFIINAPRWLNAGVYLLMGWLSLVAVQEIFAAMPVGALVWLFTGGLFFTLGAVVYIMEIPNFFPGILGFHEIWHIFVILGCASHFIVIAIFVAPYPTPIG